MSAKKAFAVFALFLMVPSLAFSQSLDQKINDAEKALNNTQATKSSLARDVARFNESIAESESAIYQTDLRISAVNAEIKSTEAEIKSTEAQLKVLRTKLGDVIRTMYEEGQVSTLEVIARSDSFSEYVNRSEYLEQVNLKVKQASDEVVAAKQKLEKDKRALTEKRAEVIKERQKQVETRNSLAAMRNQKNQLLIQTKGKESNYRKLLDKLYQQRAALSADSGEVVRGGGTGGYAYAGKCWGIDPWKFYMCQCTSYAAWNWNRVQGKHWTNSRPGQGDAYNWPRLAGDQGYSVSNTPTVGAIAVWPLTAYTPYGHVAIVTAVNGSTISVAEYNWTYREKYGTRDNVSIYFKGQTLKFIR